MMHFLRSILSLRTENEELKRRIEKLESNMEILKTSQVDLAKCTQQVALSLSDVARELANVMVYVHEISPDDTSVLFGEDYTPLKTSRKLFN